MMCETHTVVLVIIGSVCGTVISVLAIAALAWWQERS